MTTTAAKLAFETIRSLLHPLTDAERSYVMEGLSIIAVADISAMHAQLAELQVHNEQRFKDVAAAREILSATPDETLPAAARRVVGEADHAIEHIGLLREDLGVVTVERDEARLRRAVSPEPDAINGCGHERVHCAECWREDVFNK